MHSCCIPIKKTIEEPPIIGFMHFEESPLPDDGTESLGVKLTPWWHFMDHMILTITPIKKLPKRVNRTEKFNRPITRVLSKYELENKAKLETDTVVTSIRGELWKDEDHIIQQLI